MSASMTVRRAPDPSRLKAWLRRSFELDAGARRNLPMEGLRGISISLVFLVHYSLALAPWVPTTSATFRVMRAAAGIGNSGVDLFFLLSGYLIYGALIRRHQPLHRYVARRVRRIYPTFLVVLFTYVSLSFLAPSFSRLPIAFDDKVIVLVENLFLLPGMVQVSPIVGVAWSLSYEMFFYLCLPLIIGVLGLRTRRAAFRIAALAVIFGLIVANALALHGLHIRLIMFVAGILLRETIDSGRARLGSAAAVDFAAVTIVAAGFVAVWLLRESRTAPGLLSARAGANPASEIAEAIVLFVAFFLLCYSAFANSGAVARCCTVMPLRLLGNMSYSYYLVHNLALRVLFVGLALVYPPAGHQHPWMFWLCLPVSFAITWIPAAMLFLTVEKPISLSRPASTMQLNESPQAALAGVR